MASITTRVTSGGGANVKNAPLSNAEVDTNFINLNIDKLETADAVSTNTATKAVRRDVNGDFSAGQVTVTSVKTGSVVYPTTNASQTHMEEGTDTTTRYMSASSIKQAIDVLGLQSIGSVTKDMTGFEAKNTSSITVDEPTRVLTLTPSGTCVVWFRGKRYIVDSALTVELPNINGSRFVYLVPETMTLATTTDFNTAFENNVIVALIYWNANAGKLILLGDERHNSARDTTWHAAQHKNVGAVWRSGGSITYTANDASATTIALASPIVLADEDLEHTINNSASPSGYFQQTLSAVGSFPTLYLNGTVYDAIAESSSPWTFGSTTAFYNPISNGSGSLADAGEGRFISYWLIATNDQIRPIKAVMGRVAHTSLDTVYAEIFEDYGLPFAEMAPMYHVVLQTSSSFTQSPSRVKIVAVRTMLDKQATSSAAFTASSHSALSNLGNDDHLQYVHINTARTITANHTFSGEISFTGTSKLKLPAGTTAQRPASPAVGDMRFNTTMGMAEIFNGTLWGGAGGAQQGIFYENDQVIAANYTIASTKNAMTTGPVTINNGVTVTISDGATWTIV